MSRTQRRLRPTHERRRRGAGNCEEETSEMTKVTCDMAVSVDGFTAGPNQSADKPFGDGPVDRLTQWMFEQPEANAAEIEAILAAGAFIMGRNMFGPGRGEWDESWTGWWGDDPPYHAPVFVLDPPSARARGDAGRHDLQLRHRWDRVGAGAGARGGRQRRRRPSPAGPRPSTSTSRPERSTSCACTSRRSCWASGERLFDGVGAAEPRASRGQRHRPRHAPHLPRGPLGRSG